jgi:outer membrane protein assembly factor BamB
MPVNPLVQKRSNTMQNQNTIIPPQLVFAQGTLYATQQNIYALDAATGEIRQTYFFDGITSPSIMQDVLYINVTSRAHGTIQAIRVSDETVLWSYPIERSSIDPPTVTPEAVYIATSQGILHSLGANDGILRWSYEHGDPGPVIFPAPTVASDVVFFTIKVNPPYAQSLVALSAKDGTPLWKIYLSNTISFPTVIVDNVIYGSSTDGGCLAFRAIDGSLLWQRYFHGRPCSSPTVVDGIVYIAFAMETRVPLYALSAKDGSIVWRQTVKISTERGNVTRPTVANSSLYIGTNDGYLLAYSVEDGALLWRYQTKGLVLSQSIVANDIVYVGVNDGCVYALRATDGSLLWQTFVNTAISVRLEVKVQPKE